MQAIISIVVIALAVGLAVLASIVGKPKPATEPAEAPIDEKISPKRPVISVLRELKKTLGTSESPRVKQILQIIGELTLADIEDCEACQNKSPGKAG